MTTAATPLAPGTATVMLYAAITNLFQRNSLSKKLIQVVKDTNDTAKIAAVPPTNFTVMPVADADKLAKADPTLINLGPVSTDGKTRPVQASAAGIAAVANAAPLVEKPKVVHTPGQFVIETGVELPAIKRGGDRSQIYPFDQLEIGQSFFVPNTETMPNAGKTLASTVSSATRRHKASTPPRVFTIRAEALAADGVTKGARIWRIAPETATTAQAAGTDATATA